MARPGLRASTRSRTPSATHPHAVVDASRSRSLGGQLGWEIHRLLGEEDSLLTATVDVLREAAHELVTGDPPAPHEALDRVEEILGHFRSAARLNSSLQKEFARLAHATPTTPQPTAP